MIIKPHQEKRHQDRRHPPLLLHIPFKIRIKIEMTNTLNEKIVVDKILQKISFYQGM